ncbi:MAG: hypothetical protein A2599_03815 [Candidatus Staskawiczbacteria bacterium RIFOXYD1_FULL_39_28]|uniref:DUF3307 domain-containing protein n=1 Tax=Candidatus Staskawiczbacteria bacterium RIFOXYC1_FULL_38_18 TaxID=1802229 RepID=A0A1G2JC62_9BACT|nr:MAG: hypothetical protein A2401_03730 [Candidatus Staskawiczbacteria bacterium RIFOXYC1_FULL_38_18]OGZ91379.1 MAG: hypothetical protein A2599_03815 [Candidatus Staskawiczbacteria bacterium RIFOXYD1_FULL_39_28]
MILLVHMLVGALIGQKTSGLFLAIILAFLSHYFLDLFPHIEYSIKNIKGGLWRKSILDFIKIFLDFLAGLILIFFLSKNYLINYACAFFAILPDGLTVLSYLMPNKILNRHDFFHRKQVHFLKYKKISVFWRISYQAIVIISTVFLFLI